MRAAQRSQSNFWEVAGETIIEIDATLLSVDL
jgi:hypothetical protein